MTFLAAALLGVAVGLMSPRPAERRVRSVLRTRPRPSRREPAGSVATYATSRLAGLLDLLAAALDAGLAPVNALSVVAVGVPEPARGRLLRAVSMIDLGGDAATVWRLLADDAILGPLAHALERSNRSGAPVAAAVRGIADEIRRERRAALLAAARRVGVRTAAPLGACFLPAFFLIAIVPTVVALLHHTLGWSTGG